MNSTGRVGSQAAPAGIAVLVAQRAAKAPQTVCFVKNLISIFSRFPPVCAGYDCNATSEVARHAASLPAWIDRTIG
jgi:hypothetical protein